MSDAPRDSDSHYAGNRTDPGQDPDQFTAGRTSEKRVVLCTFHLADSSKALMSQTGFVIMLCSESIQFLCSRERTVPP